LGASKLETLFGYVPLESPFRSMLASRTKLGFGI